MATDEQRMEYLTRLFEETYIKDIIERNHIEKVQEINSVCLGQNKIALKH